MQKAWYQLNSLIPQPTTLQFPSLQENTFLSSGQYTSRDFFSFYGIPFRLLVDF